MTLNSILKQLCSIDCKAQKLIKEAGFSQLYGLDDQLRPKSGDLDEAFLADCIEGILDGFSELHDEISYLGKPTHGEFTLIPFPDGRYGYFDDHGNSNTFHCGAPIEAKVPDFQGNLKWVRTRIEHDGTDFYLVRHHSVPLDGLVIRERW